MRLPHAVLGFLLLWEILASATPMRVPLFTAERLNMILQDAENADVSQQCKQPVCWAGDTEDQSCYTCEYGKSSQHVVCTPKGSKKDRYYNQAQDLNNRKDECPAPSGTNQNKYQNKAPKN